MSSMFLIRTGLKVGLLACALLASSVNAHHSYSRYDFNNRIALEGTITRFDFVAPHIRVDVEVTHENGVTELWEIESTSPTRWRAAELDEDFVRVDDHMIVNVWPTRDGSLEAVLSSFISEEGVELMVRASRRDPVDPNIGPAVR